MKKGENIENFSFLFFIFLSVIILLPLSNASISKSLEASDYRETTTYKDSYWICPDGERSQETSCDYYSSLLNKAETFCNQHCRQISTNVRECNADFHRGETCTGTSSTQDSSSDVATSETSEDTTLPNDDSSSSNGQQSGSICSDSDSNLSYPDFLKIKGICRDNTGNYSDTSLGGDSIMEYACHHVTFPSRDICYSTVFDCNVTGLDYGPNGACIERYQAQGASNHNVTGQSNLTGGATLYNPNSEAYTPSSDPATSEDNSSLQCNPGECELDGACYPLGYRVRNIYCSESGFKDQLSIDSPCQNNLECKSKVCKENRCQGLGFFQRITAWFKNLF